MARESHDRENLLRDATAYRTRIQIQPDSSHLYREVFIGFHSNGALSVYLDQDPVYHFNRSHELRRAFVDGVLVKAENGQLVGMHRQREERESLLVRHPFTDDEASEFCSAAVARLNEVQAMLVGKNFTIEGIVSDDSDDSVLQRSIDFLSQLQQLAIAKSPRVTS